MRSLVTVLNRQPLGRIDGMLTPALADLYEGDLIFTKSPSDRPFTMINFVQTLDGLTSFSEPGHAGGADISMRNPYDTFIMGLLRALSDGVAVGANTLRSEPDHLWTSGFISAEHESLYQELRRIRGKKTKNPLNILVTGSGRVIPGDTLPAVFRKEDIDTLIVTTEHGKAAARRQFEERGLQPPRILAIGEGKEVGISAMMSALYKEYGIETLLIEGGSGFNGSVVDSGEFDEKFITRSPIVIGTDKDHPRPTFATGMARHANDGVLHNLVSIKVAGDHIFERWKQAE